MKETFQQHCSSTLNHNLAYCYNDARVIKWLWSNVIKNRFQGGLRSFEDKGALTVNRTCVPAPQETPGEDRWSIQIHDRIRTEE